MIGKILVRFGTGLLVGVVEFVQVYTANYDFSEAGVYAALFGLGATVVVTVLGLLGRKIGN